MIFVPPCPCTQAQAAAQGGYDPKRGAVLYQQQQQQQQEQGGGSGSGSGTGISSEALTAEGEPLPADFLCAWGVARVYSKGCLPVITHMHTIYTHSPPLT